MIPLNLKEAKQFYKSNAWRVKRASILQRDNFECQRCKKMGKVTPANTVHHIKHLRDAPEHALVDSNLISLCAACHNNVHNEKQIKIKRRNEERKEKIHDEKWE